MTARNASSSATVQQLWVANSRCLWRLKKPTWQTRQSSHRWAKNRIKGWAGELYRNIVRFNQNDKKSAQNCLIKQRFYVVKNQFVIKSCPQHGRPEVILQSTVQKTNQNPQVLRCGVAVPKETYDTRIPSQTSQSKFGTVSALWHQKKYLLYWPTTTMHVILVRKPSTVYIQN